MRCSTGSAFFFKLYCPTVMFTRELNTAWCVEIWSGAFATEIITMECFNTFTAGQTNLKILLKFLPLLYKRCQLYRMWYAIKNASLIIDNLSLKCEIWSDKTPKISLFLSVLNIKLWRTGCRCWRHFIKPAEMWGCFLRNGLTFILGCMVATQWKSPGSFNLHKHAVNVSGRSVEDW